MWPLTSAHRDTTTANWFLRTNFVWTACCVRNWDGLGDEGGVYSHRPLICLWEECNRVCTGTGKLQRDGDPHFIPSPSKYHWSCMAPSCCEGWLEQFLRFTNREKPLSDFIKKSVEMRNGIFARNGDLTVFEGVDVTSLTQKYKLVDNLWHISCMQTGTSSLPPSPHLPP